MLIFLIITMGGTLFEINVRMKGVTTLGYQSAYALGDPVRIKILEILGHKQMTTDEISKMLRRAGQKKATTTIRHHLDILKDAGLLEVTKMVEVRGAVQKYYATTLRAFSYDAANLEKQSKLIEDISAGLQKILKCIFEDEKFIIETTRKKNTCSICKGGHYMEYVALEILNNALAKALQSKEYAMMIRGKKEPKN